MDPRSAHPGSQPTGSSARIAPSVSTTALPQQAHAYGRRQATLAAFSRRVLSVSNLPELLEAAARAIGHALQAEYVAAFEFDRGADVLWLRTGNGWREGCVGSAKLHTGTEFQEGYALDRPEPIVVADHNAEIRFAASPLLVEHGVLSSVCTAVRTTQAPFGLLGAYASRPRAFTQDDAQFLQVVSDVTSTNLARIEAESALVQSRAARVRVQHPERSSRSRPDVTPEAGAAVVDRHRRRLEASKRVAELATSNQALDLRLRDVLEEITSATGFPMGAIELWNAERGVVVLGAAIVAPQRQASGPIEQPLDSTLAGPVIRSGKASIESIESTTPERRAALQRIGAHTFVCFPLTVQDLVIGALSLATPGPQACDDDFSTWLAGLCHCVSLLVKSRADEHALQLGQERSRLFFNLGLGVAVTHPDGRFLEVNPALCRILGYDSHELLKKTWMDVTHPDDLENCVQFGKQIEKDGVAQYALEKRFVTKRNATVHARVYGSTARDAEGHGQYDLVVLEDITEAHRIQTRLERLEAQNGHDLNHERTLIARAQENERARLSRDLHEGPRRVLAALRLALQSKARDRADLRSELSTLDLAASMLLRMSETLHPVALQTSPLSHWVRASLTSETSTPSIRVEITGSEPMLAVEHKTHLFRIVHEAVANAFRHAEPRQVWVRFAWGSDALELTIENDGRGIDVGLENRAPHGGGVRDMLERAQLVGGSVAWEPRDGGGTLVRVRIPQLSASRLDTPS